MRDITIQISPNVLISPLSQWILVDISIENYELDNIAILDIGFEKKKVNIGHH